MVIENYDTGYEVKNVWNLNTNMPIYLCESQKENKEYVLFSIAKESLPDKVIEFLWEQNRTNEFKDFKDVFLFEDRLYVVMAYVTGTSLEETLSTLTDRKACLEVGRRVLEAVMIQKLHPYFAVEVCTPVHILVSDSLEIRFHYTLENLIQADTYQMQDFYIAFSKLLNRIWTKELEMATVPEVKDYMIYLSSEEEKSLADVYRKYEEMERAFLRVSEQERKVPKLLPFRVWKHVKKGIPLLKKGVAFIVLILVFLYFLHTIYTIQKPQGETLHQIEYIGTRNVVD